MRKGLINDLRSILPVMYGYEEDGLACCVNGGVKFGHCGGAKVGQFGASALERAALI
jgi:hypothetical protein